MLIMLKADVIGLLGSLQIAKRFAEPKRAQLIRDNCISEDDLAMKIAEVYRLMYPEREANRLLAKQREKEFFEEHCRIRVAYSRARPEAGFCVLNGELLALHSQLPWRGAWLLDHAINEGAKFLNCFDVPPLVQLYTGRGFREVSRFANHNQGGPDVLVMQRD